MRKINDRTGVAVAKAARSLRRTLVAATALAVFAAPVAARADDFQELGFLPGGTYSYSGTFNSIRLWNRPGR